MTFLFLAIGVLFLNKQPSATAEDIFRLLNRFGPYGRKRSCGSSPKHVKFVKLDGKGVPVVVPAHPGRTIKPGTLRQIIETIAENEGIGPEEVWRLLE